MDSFTSPDGDAHTLLFDIDTSNIDGTFGRATKHISHCSTTEGRITGQNHQAEHSKTIFNHDDSSAVIQSGMWDVHNGWDGRTGGDCVFQASSDPDPFSGFDIPFWLEQDEQWDLLNQ
jgi:hypothetical protein